MEKIEEEAKDIDVKKLTWWGICPVQIHFWLTKTNYQALGPKFSSDRKITIKPSKIKPKSILTDDSRPDFCVEFEFEVKMT